MVGLKASPYSNFYLGMRLQSHSATEVAAPKVFVDKIVATPTDKDLYDKTKNTSPRR